MAASQAESTPKSVTGVSVLKINKVAGAKNGKALVKKEPTSSGRYKRLKSLGDDRIAMITAMFMEGKAAAVITRVIQEDWGELPDIKHESLARDLVRFKKEEIDPKIMMQGNLLSEDTRQEIIRRMKGQLDVLDEMKSLCIDQTARYKAMALKAVNSMHQKDESHAATEGERLHRMLKELAGLQMESGIIPRAPRVVSAHVNFQRTAAEDAYLSDVSVRKETTAKARQIIDVLRESDAIDAEFEEVPDTETEEPA